MKIAVMIDANNLFYTLKLKYSRKLDYAKYLEYIEHIGDVSLAEVHGIHVRGQAIDFITKLKSLGYLPLYMNVHERDKNKIKATVRIVVNAIAQMVCYDTIVIGSSDKNLIPLLDYLKAQKKKVIILATDIPNTMKTAAYKCIEIPFSMLESS